MIDLLIQSLLAIAWVERKLSHKATCLTILVAAQEEDHDSLAAFHWDLIRVEK